jgi:hypothetical protein
MSRVSGINRPAQVSLRPWDFDLGNPGAVSTQYLVFGSSEGEASMNVKSRMPTDEERIGLRRLAPCPLHAYYVCAYTQHCMYSALSPGQSSPPRRYVLFQCRVVIVVMELKVDHLGEEDASRCFFSQQSTL